MYFTGVHKQKLNSLVCYLQEHPWAILQGLWDICPLHSSASEGDLRDKLRTVVARQNFILEFP